LSQHPQRITEGPDDAAEAVREQSEDTSGTDTAHAVYENGFTVRTFVGALFVAFVMMPGAIYLGLVSGTSLGSASEWVTIVLFAEVARRSFMPLKRQEIYIIFYIAAALSHLNASLGVVGGPFGDRIYDGFLHVANQAVGQHVRVYDYSHFHWPDPMGWRETTVSQAIPTWSLPPEQSPVWTVRTFFHPDWIVPIALLVGGSFIDMIARVTGGYALFRMTSDIERLPFPMAPVQAAGATALAEAGSKEESWRWRVFSIGAMMGLVYGFFYLGIPIFTGVILPKPLMLIQLPFIDLTQNTEGLLPGAAVGLSGNLGLVVEGFVLPFALVAGLFFSSAGSQLLVNPFMQQHGWLPTWRPGANALWTRMASRLDYWMSVEIGLKLAVGVIGLILVARTLWQMRGRREERRLAYATPPGRGDFSWKIAIGFFLACQLYHVIVGKALVPYFPLWILIGFAFLYTPLISYVSARLYGMAGRAIELPYAREAMLVRSGYHTIDIWFMPTSLSDYGGYAQRFREAELTGTKLTSIVRAEAIIWPLILVASFMFWAFLWHTSAIPSSQFPFAQMFWPIEVNFRVMWMTATVETSHSVEQFKHAIRASLIGPSLLGGLGVYALLAAMKVPAFFFYGVVAGTGQLMHENVSRMLGALLGRYYFQKRFGLTDWRRYSPVLLAGFTCGMGLIAMVAIALGLIVKSVSFLPY
jgi:hypothetical protein